jgi:hypothetical protein
MKLTKKMVWGILLALVSVLAVAEDLPQLKIGSQDDAFDSNVKASAKQGGQMSLGTKFAIPESAKTAKNATNKSKSINKKNDDCKLYSVVKLPPQCKAQSTK